MGNIITLYHGTIYEFDKIEVAKGKPFKDFGVGLTARSPAAANVLRLRCSCHFPDFERQAGSMVEFNESTCQALIDLHTVRLVETLAEREGKPKTDCVRELMASKTYELLADPQSYLCLESPAYILDMLDAERSGNWERWLEV